MNQLWNPMNLAGPDLNVEAQTLSLLRTTAQDSHASRYARVCAIDDSSAPDHLSLLRRESSGRLQGSRVLLPGSILRYGVCKTDRARIVARYRSQPVSLSQPPRAIAAAVSHWLSLQADCAQHAGQPVSAKHVFVSINSLDWPFMADTKCRGSSKRIEF